MLIISGICSLIALFGIFNAKINVIEEWDNDND